MRPPTGPSSAPPRPPGAFRAANPARERVANLLGVLAALWFIVVNAGSLVESPQPFEILFVLQMAWFAVAFVRRRSPTAISARPADWVITIVGSFGWALLRGGSAEAAWSVWAGRTLQILGLGVWTASFAVLGRSFGMVPADRGLVTRGSYAYVRHPLYLSYMLSQAGYLLQNASTSNAIVIAVVWSCNLARIRAEERLLSAVDDYGRYRQHVRWRLVPGLW
jgi:protein-S-isoprenylcysteine O-methyltransferase Ste14